MTTLNRRVVAVMTAAICLAALTTNVEAQALACANGGVYNSATKSCTCRPGWGGNTCTVCETDTVCASSLSNAADPVCTNDYAYNYKNEVKYLSCKATGLAGSLVQQNSLVAACNTTAATCGLSFLLLQTPTNLPVNCTATRCSFGKDATSVDCASVTCACQPACTGVYGSLLSTLNSGIGIACTSAGDCSISVPAVQFSLTGNCDAGACVDGAADLAIGRSSPVLSPTIATTFPPGGALGTSG